MTQPAPASRHTVDSLTDDELQQLYDERDRYRAAWTNARKRSRNARGAWATWMRIAEKRRALLIKAERAANIPADSHRRAERAEAALNVMAGHLRYVLDGKAPRHRHLVPGRWDIDGSRCTDCARLADARAALDAHTNPKDQT
ncbi:hypothetical protein AB0B30_32625 [Streptomyces narbonensis]|uniref:Uncharacterized protein n=1 Tax=Streptomyces narbonensis TaxID=67333 RepID=A0ABV3CJS4_9ACTN